MDSANLLKAENISAFINWYKQAFIVKINTFRPMQNFSGGGGDWINLYATMIVCAYSPMWYFFQHPLENYVLAYLVWPLKPI